MSYKKKILLISNNGIGLYNFKRELIENLIKMEYEVHFAVPGYEKLSILSDMGAIFHELSLDRRGKNIKKELDFLRQLNKLIGSLKPDVVVLHTIKPNLYAGMIATLRRIPYLNNITGLGSALQTEGITSKILRMMYKVCLKASKGIFFENSSNCDYFRRHHIGTEEQYVVVPGAGVNTEHFEARAQFHKADSLEATSSNIIFLMIARIMKEKGIEEYLDAAVILKEKYLDAEFQILGYYDEYFYQQRVEQLHEKGVIRYLGVSDDTRIEMSQADCIVLPSYHEGMSNVLLEGAAMGLPLITTDIPGCREAVEDGKTGFLCKVKDSESLAEAMERFLLLSREERTEMGRLGRLKMEREFDRQIVVDSYIRRIQDAIKG